MQITVIIFLTLITLFELKIYKSNIKSLKSYIGYYKFIKSNKNIKFAPADLFGQSAGVIRTVLK